MEDRDTRYHLHGIVELDDTYIGGKKKPGKQGRGAADKVPVMIALESRSKACGHVGLREVSSVTSVHTKEFITTCIGRDTIMFSDG